MPSTPSHNGWIFTARKQGSVMVKATTTTTTTTKSKTTLTFLSIHPKSFAISQQLCVNTIVKAPSSVTRTNNSSRNKKKSMPFARSSESRREVSTSAAEAWGQTRWDQRTIYMSLRMACMWKKRNFRLSTKATTRNTRKQILWSIQLSGRRRRHRNSSKLNKCVCPYRHSHQSEVTQSDAFAARHTTATTVAAAATTSWFLFGRSGQF